jgi:hypothetical protein
MPDKMFTRFETDVSIALGALQFGTEVVEARFERYQKSGSRRAFARRHFSLKSVRSRATSPKQQSRNGGLISDPPSHIPEKWVSIP